MIFKRSKKSDEIQAEPDPKLEARAKAAAEYTKKIKEAFPVGTEVDVCGVKGVVMRSGAFSDFLTVAGVSYRLDPTPVVGVYFPSTDREVEFTPEQLGESIELEAI